MTALKRPKINKKFTKGIRMDESTLTNLNYLVRVTDQNLSQVVSNLINTKAEDIRRVAEPDTNITFNPDLN